MINGTNIIHSFLAKDRVLPPPIGLSLDQVPAKLGLEGNTYLTLEEILQEVVAHQRLLLKLLNEEEVPVDKKRRKESHHI